MKHLLLLHMEETCKVAVELSCATYYYTIDSLSLAIAPRTLSAAAKSSFYLHTIERISIWSIRI